MLEKIKKGIGIFSLFWQILTKRQRVLFFAIFFSILLGAALETLGVSILIPFVQAILTPKELIQKEIIKIILAAIGINDEFGFVVFITVAVIVFYFLKNIYLVLTAYWQQKYRCDVQKYVSVSILKSYLHYPYSYFIKTNSSELLRNVITDADGLMSCINSIFSILTQIFIVLLITIFLFVTDPFIASCLVVSIVFVLLVPIVILGRPIRQTGIRLRENAAACYKSALQAISGIKEIIMYGKQDFFSAEYESSYKKKADNDIRSCVYTSLPGRLIEAICISALALSLCIKRTGGSLNVAMIAQLSAFAMAAFKLLPSVSTISQSFNTLILSYPVLSSVHNNINNKVAKLLLNNSSKNAVRFTNFTNQIKFQNVAFHYENKEKVIFSNVNVTINKGDVVGIVGPSGAGKTTFVDVLLGLLKNTEGKILVDGVDLDDENIVNWRSKIAYVPQTAYLIDDTILANVAFGQKEIDEKLVSDVLKEAMLQDYINNLPEGVNTVVGERGVAMSGGQRQRLSIARALYTKPEIIVFDEATSALDEKTEKEIMESVDNLIGKQTLFIIAHRLSTLKKCTKILQIENGKVLQKESL
jgi:ABC-type multidrug transport system fused ATPase/permease subunit